MAAAAARRHEPARIDDDQIRLTEMLRQPASRDQGLHACEDRRAERLLLTLALSMYLGFLGYVMFPAFGPVGAMDGLLPLGVNAGTAFVATYGVALEPSNT